MDTLQMLLFFLAQKKLKGCCLKINCFHEKYKNVKGIVTISNVKTKVCKNQYYNERLNGCYNNSICFFFA